MLYVCFQINQVIPRVNPYIANGTAWGSELLPSFISTVISLANLLFNNNKI